MYIYIYIFIYLCIHILLVTITILSYRTATTTTTTTSITSTIIGRPILYTTTTQRGWCIGALVSILAQSQSQNSLSGGGGV